MNVQYQNPDDEVVYENIEMLDECCMYYSPSEHNLNLPENPCVEKLAYGQSFHTIEDVDDADQLMSFGVAQVHEGANDQPFYVTIEDVEEVDELLSREEGFDEECVESLEDTELKSDTNNQVPVKSRNYDPVARKIRYQATRIKFLTQKIKKLQSVDGSSLMEYLSSKLRPEQFQFVQLQLRNAKRSSKGKRYKFEDKSLALAIFKQSPKCYRFLSKMFDLPSKQTLNKHSAKIRFQEGVSPKLMQYIKDTVATLDKVDKNVTIAWDEMALIAHLDFQETKDYIDGFQDAGSNGKNDFATHALVFMVRGLNSGFKQPIAYFLTENINSGELVELIKLIIEAVFRTGKLFQFLQLQI